jgi:hypothetical protein
MNSIKDPPQPSAFLLIGVLLVLSTPLKGIGGKVHLLEGSTAPNPMMHRYITVHIHN